MLGHTQRSPVIGRMSEPDSIKDANWKEKFRSRWFGFRPTNEIDADGRGVGAIVGRGEGTGRLTVFGR